MHSLSELTGRLGHDFSSTKLLKLALTHPSLGDNNNQRLEFLGDAVLQLCISDLLYQRHGKLQEGELTRLRAALVCEEALYDVAQALELRHHVKSRPPVKDNSRGARGVLADAVEAILAAVYLDGGFEAVRLVTQRLWQDKLSADFEQPNPKGLLQELLQAGGHSEPSYQTLAEEGPPHSRQYTVAVSFEGQELARGQGPSKKDAERQAAAEALSLLKGREGRDEA